MLYGSQKINAETLCEKRSHQLWEPRKVRRNVKSKSLLPVREGSLIWRSNANVPSPFPTSLWETIEQRRNANLNYLPPVLGRYKNAAMLGYCRPILTRGQTPVAEMLFENRLSREGSSCPRRNAIHGSPFPTSLWAVLETQKCHVTDAHQFMGGSEETHSNVTGIALSHQLGKDIICTLIKPLLFLPFLLIYGGQRISAEMPRVICSQGEGQFIHHRNVIRRTPFPTRFGPSASRRNAIATAPNITRGHNRDAAMPHPNRLATRKEVKWTQDIKTRLSQ